MRTCTWSGRAVDEDLCCEDDCERFRGCAVVMTLAGPFRECDCGTGALVGRGVCVALDAILPIL